MRSHPLQLSMMAAVLLSGLVFSQADGRRDPGPRWGPAPAIFPAGAEFAVLQGDPSAAGKVFTVRLRFPDKYVIPAHQHPTDENITVMRGSFAVGMGDVFSEEGLTTLEAGDFIVAPAGMNHFARARGVTEVQVHAVGPFQLTYADPKSDPRK